jgi:hypothetical protein
MPAYVGNPLAGDPICEASSAFELRIAITTKQVSRAGHPSDLLVAKRRRVASHDETHAWDDERACRPRFGALLQRAMSSVGQTPTPSMPNYRQSFDQTRNPRTVVAGPHHPYS